MDGFEWNKIIGAILGTLLFVMGAGFLAEAIYEPFEGSGGGYALPGEAEHDVSDGGGEGAPTVPLPVLLAAADVSAGANQTRLCARCHDFAEGGANKVGPPLWDIVGRPIAGAEGYSYSDAMKALGDAGEQWTLVSLDQFVAGPRQHVPGTKMSYAGMRDAEDRADLLIYLHSLSANPQPLPAPPEAEAPALTGETAPAADSNAPGPAPDAMAPVEPAAESPAPDTHG
jgi:cytochrome c